MSAIMCASCAGQTMAQKVSDAPQTAVLEKDHALGGSNAVAVSGETVRELLARLDTDHQRRLTAEDDIGDDRLVAFARKQSTAQVMLSLERLLHAAWRPTPSAEAPSTYTIYSTQEAKSRAEILWRRTQDRALEPLHRLVGYLRTPAAEFARQKKEAEQRKEEPKDPLLRGGNLYYLSHESSRNALALVATLSDEELRDLMTNGYYVLPWDSMSDDQRPLAASLAAFIGDERSKEIDHNLVRPGEKSGDSLKWLRQFGLVLYLSTDPLTWAVYEYDCGSGGTTYSGVKFGPTLASLQNLLPVRGNPYLPVRTQAVPAYPELSRMAFPADFDVNKVRDAPWSAILEELSRHTSLPIFSDHFTFLSASWTREGKPLPVLTGMDLPRGLDALCERYHYLWWYEGGCLYFRSRAWFIESLYEVPPRTQALLQKQLEEHGELDIRGMDALSRLTVWQLEGVAALAAHGQGPLVLSRTDSMMYIQQCIIALGSARHTFGYLQIYGMLSAEEKRLAMSEAGLPLEDMTAEQGRALYLWVMLTGWFEIGDLNARVSIRIKQREQSDVASAESPQTPRKHSLIVMIWFEAMHPPDRAFASILLDMR